MVKSSRNYGIDLLRSVSILGVVFLHVLWHGGLLNLFSTTANYSIVWFFETLAYPAVNCFVLISGFVGYRENNYCPKLKNIIALFLTVVFFGVSIAVVFKILYPSAIGMTAIIKAFIPVTTCQYWFFTAYFGLFLLTPILNMIVHTAGKKILLTVTLAIAFFSGVTILRDSFALKGGYSLVWFIFLYLLGAIIKKYDWSSVFSKKVWFLLAIGSFLITWISKVSFHFTDISALHGREDSFVAYTSPTIVLMAISLVCLFAKINCKLSFVPIICFLSTSAFSVYLIHDNVHVQQLWMPEISKYAIQYSTWSLALFIICAAVLIFAACVLIDKIRILLFKLLRVDSISAKAEAVIKTLIDRICNKI